MEVKAGIRLILVKINPTYIHGHIQPFKAKWNRKGYGYNAVYTIKIKVE
ncbi:hypothetical protein [Desulfosporosinus sp.]|nr:hypothetical protein [Desulfosporosinus sp.]